MTNSYNEILDQISAKALACGRDPKTILTVAISKNQPLEAIQKVYQSGCRNFGENRMQEALPKMEEAPKDIQWHFVGTLQKNKVNKAIGQFALIHSVDSFELAKKIASEAKTKVLLQINTSGERTKHGLEDGRQIDEILKLEGLDVQGFMTMAPLTSDQNLIRACFSKLRKLKENYHLQHLSMGMSNDYLIAIEEGATILRIGTAIFEHVTH